MKTYDEIVENVIEATAAHRRRVKKIQQIAAASFMCTACIFGLSVYLNLEPQQVIRPSEETTTVTFPTLDSAAPELSETENTASSGETPGSCTTPGEFQTPSTDIMEPPAPPVTDISGQVIQTAPPESGEASTGTGMISTETNAEQGSTVIPTDTDFDAPTQDPTEESTEADQGEWESAPPPFDPTEPSTEEPTIEEPNFDPTEPPTEEPTIEEPSWTIPDIDNPADTAPPVEDTDSEVIYETTQAVYSTAAATTTTTTSTSAQALAGKTSYTTTSKEPPKASSAPLTNAKWLSWASAALHFEEKISLQNVVSYETVQFPIE